MSIFKDKTDNLFKGRQNIKTRKQIDVRVDDFSGGVNVLFSETRLKPDQAKEATNLILDEDGVWKKRWGTQAYGGVSFTNTIDGFTEYRKSDGTRELVVVADGKAYVVDPSAETKTQISGSTFTQGYRCDFAQIDNYLYIVNGQDSLTRYDGSTLSTYSSISTPSWAGTPLTRGAGLSTGNYNVYYRVSAVNEVGETLAAAEETLTVDIKRDEWDETDEYIDLDWDTVTSAIKYNVYYSDVSGYEVKLGETTDDSFRDDGSATPNGYIEPPVAATSDGPTTKSVSIIGNRVWATNDPSNPQRVYFSGTGVNLGNFGVGFGGGWIDLETGSRNQTVKAIDFNRDSHIICRTDDGRGSIWMIDFTSVEVGSESVIIPAATKIIAQMGTPAQRSIVHAENDVYFLNPFGVFTLGYEPNVLNVLRTKERSAPIRPYIRSAYESSLDKSCAYYYDSKVFFSIPTASGEPNRIFLYDRELDAWEKDWTVGVSQFGEFTDAGGDTHFLGINGTVLIEFSENIEGDQGSAFTWRYVSPRFPISKDWTQFAFISKATIKMRNARGTPQFSFTGTNMEGSSPTLATDTLEQGASDTGVGWDIVGEFKVGTTGGTPTLFAQESLIRYLPIDELLRDIQWEVSGNSMADKGVLTGLTAEGYIIETDSPDSWLLA